MNKENIIKVFGDCKIDFFDELDIVEITLTTGEYFQKITFSSEVSECKTVLSHMKKNAAYEIKTRIIKDFIEENRKDKNYVVSSIVPKGTKIISPFEHYEIEKEKIKRIEELTKTLEVYEIIICCKHCGHIFKCNSDKWYVDCEKCGQTNEND